MIKWFKTLFRVVRNYDSDRKRLLKQVRSAERTIRERTELSVDIAAIRHHHNQIIVTGRYRNADYVQVFTINDNDLACLIDQLRSMQKYGVIQHVDAVYNISAVVKRELEF